MRNIVTIAIVVILLIGCNRQHIYHTYYGDIDIDTMQVALEDLDNALCYTVQVLEKDSFMWDEEIKHLPSPATIVYCPDKNIYYKVSPDNQGRQTISIYDPSTKNLEWLDR